MEGRAQRHLVLILARELASKLATPALVSDASGELVFYNEPAGELLGRTYAEAGALPAARWSELFAVEDEEGRPLPLERMPAGVAFAERRPAHGRVRITALDGRRRLLSVTAIPLFASAAELVGVVALFWEETDPAS
ncbi:MAG TPA: PAS domain-containing protein [Gaiellaceae bacterium]|nr:PAS domain-containing protein [Gaiellaceae bacterium]